MAPAETPQFPTASGCEIKVSSRKYCVAVDKQLGTRTVSGFRTVEVCTPAVVGPPPPFACTGESPLTCGQGSCPSGNVCQLDTGTLACACLPE